MNLQPIAPRFAATVLKGSDPMEGPKEISKPWYNNQGDYDLFIQLAADEPEREHLGRFLDTNGVLTLKLRPDAQRWSVEILNPEHRGGYLRPASAVQFLALGDVLQKITGPGTTRRVKFMNALIRDLENAGRLQGAGWLFARFQKAKEARKNS